MCSEIRCPSLPAPDKGSAAPCDTRLSSVCEFTCQEGYILGSGSSRRICLEDGTWSGSDALCQGQAVSGCVGEGVSRSGSQWVWVAGCVKVRKPVGVGGRLCQGQEASGCVWQVVGSGH